MQFRKIVPIVLGSCLLSLIGFWEIKIANATPIRYFMQAEDVKGSETPYGNNTSVGHYAQADDAKIYYEVYGKGKPIIVLHGGGVGTPYEMGAMIDNLRRDYQVVVGIKLCGKVKVVEHFADIKVQVVNSFPGVE